ncbi:uncharacterized protein LOC106670617 [Cimex lectularius]|uniref:RanBP-type and C3HC4-type zinc finger-containing protein 1 n=1 Tax=Cimex lectularius TaxID=79782 RepID=A0A8I6TJQ3_CIMLE|nr:uncharacterized protein LOC106670617 [Cimex lectularius]
MEKQAESRPKFLIGERVLWLGSGSGLPKSGQVKWIGRLLEIGPNLAVGLELDEPLPYGGIDGTWGSRQLFRCESKHGLIVPSSSVIPQPQHRAPFYTETKSETRKSSLQVSTLNRSKIARTLFASERYLSEGSSPIVTRKTRESSKFTRGFETLPRPSGGVGGSKLNLHTKALEKDRDGKIFGRTMNREFRRSDDHLERTSSINSSKSASSRRDRSSGIFSIFKWFKKDKSLDSDDFDSPPLPGSPILARKNGSICGSIDTLFSTATVTSFAFVPPSYYKPFGAANQPEIRIALGPDTNTYKNRIKERDELRRFDNKISLREKYKLYASGTLPRSVDRINEIRDGPPSDSESKSSSIRKKKRKAPPPPLTQSENSLPDAQNKENNPLRHHRRALSEPEAAKYIKACHVKGKRKAPPPPAGREERTLSLTRKKRPAPPPPNVNPKKEKEDISKIIQKTPFDINNSNQEQEDSASNTNKTETCEVISTDTLRLERGVLKQNKVDRPMSEPKFSPSSPVSPRPWYKRNTPHKQESVIWRLDKKKPAKKDAHDSKFLESGFPRKFTSGENKFINIFSKIDKPEEKRKSQISILTNISELDREAAEIVKNNKAREQTFLAELNKTFYPDRSEIERVSLNENLTHPTNKTPIHRVVLDEAEVRIVDTASSIPEPENKIAKVTIEELDEYDAERNSKAQTMYEVNRMYRHQSPPISMIPEVSESSAKSSSPSSSIASSSTYESTTSKPELKVFGGQLVWICPRCTLENCRWKITCGACDLWRPSPCDFKEKSKPSESQPPVMNPKENKKSSGLKGPSTSRDLSNEIIDQTTKLVENISKGINIAMMMDKKRDEKTNVVLDPDGATSTNQIDKQAEEVRLARLAFFDKYSTPNNLQTRIPILEETNKFSESSDNKRNITVNINVEKEPRKHDVAQNIEECRQILNSISENQGKKDIIRPSSPNLRSVPKISNKTLNEPSTSNIKNEVLVKSDATLKMSLVEGDKNKNTSDITAIQSASKDLTANVRALSNFANFKNINTTKITNNSAGERREVFPETSKLGVTPGAVEATVKSEDNKVTNDFNAVPSCSKDNLMNCEEYSKITSCINSVPGTSRNNLTLFEENVKSKNENISVATTENRFVDEPTKNTNRNNESRSLNAVDVPSSSKENPSSTKTTNIKVTQTPETPRIVSKDIEESRRMLKEMLKEMKHSLPKRPEIKKESSKKEEKHLHRDNSDVAEAYLIESETIVEEIKLKKPSEKVSSSAQTSAMVRQIVPKVKPSSGSQIIVPMTIEEYQIKDGVLYTSVTKKQAKKIGTGTFELLRPRDFANIEAVKAHNAMPPLYVNVDDDPGGQEQAENKNQEVEKLSEQLTRPQGLANFRAGLGNEASNMNTMAVNRLLKRLEGAIANGQLELAAILAKELAQMKVSCSVTRQKPELPVKLIPVELYIEDKHNHRGPFPLKISPKMTLAELKKQVEVEYDLPSNVQRWILGKNLASDNSATLESMGVDKPQVPLFLYLVVPDANVQTTNDASGVEGSAEISYAEDREKKSEGGKIELQATTSKEPLLEKVIPIQNLAEQILEEETEEEIIEEVEDPDVEIEEPDTPVVQDETKEFPFGTLALGWKCRQCTLINRPTRVKCAACNTEKPTEYKVPVEYKVTEEEKRENYQKLMDLEKDDLIISMEEFECPICLVRYEPNDGVILRECLHVFCRGCLAHTVEYSEEAEVKCPYRDDIYTCDSTLLEREIKALVTPRVYEGHLAKSIALAETKIGNTFHCKTPDCKGWCIYEDNVNVFKCPVCTHINCVTCQAVHEGLDCKQYQEQVNLDSETNVESKRTKEMLQEMVDRGEAMNCPTCQVVLMKKWGCDWLRCSMCKTEICWITRGPRWGPNGKGDTSGGCQCGVNGVKCHPKCTYCH